MEIFWELNKINYQEPNILKTGVENKIFLKALTGELIAPKMTEIINKDNINLCFDLTLEDGQKLIVNGTEYVLKKIAISEISEKKEIKLEIMDSALETFEITPPPEVTISYSEDTLKITGNVIGSVYLILEYFTTESYPEVPFKEEKFTINIEKEYVRKVEKDKGIKCLARVETLEDVNLKTMLLDSKPIVHFSNTPSLRKDIVELGIKVATYSDEEMKKLITEKSIVLYSKFGLLYEQTYNPTLTPIYKSIVNLYCIKDLMALGFLTGELQSDTSGDGSGTTYSVNQIQLGNLSVKDGTSGSGGTGATSTSKISNLLGTSIIEEMIKIEEEKLVLSLREISENVKKWGVKNNESKQLLRFNQQHWRKGFNS